MAKQPNTKNNSKGFEETLWPEFDSFKAHFGIEASNHAGLRAAEAKTPSHMDF